MEPTSHQKLKNTAPKNTSEKHIEKSTKKIPKVWKQASVCTLFGSKRAVEPEKPWHTRTCVFLKENLGSRGLAAAKEQSNIIFGLTFIRTSNKTRKKCAKHLQKESQREPKATKKRKKKQTRSETKKTKNGTRPLKKTVLAMEREARRDFRVFLKSPGFWIASLARSLRSGSLVFPYQNLPKCVRKLSKHLPKYSPKRSPKRPKIGQKCQL